MNKEYTLIVQDRYSLSNETDSHPQSDYSPGVWSIKTQKSTLRFARQILADGDKITRVTIYDNPKYAVTANYFIKELGLDYPLFQEPEAIKQGPVDNGKPATLGALKKYLSLGTHLIIGGYLEDGTLRERATFVKKVQTNNIVLDKLGGNSWLEFGKASEWSFINEAAIQHRIDRDTGKNIPCIKITYLTQ